MNRPGEKTGIMKFKEIKEVRLFLQTNREKRNVKNKRSPTNE